MASGLGFTGLGAGSEISFAAYRTDLYGTRVRPGFRYPSPFFDIGHTYLPSNIKSLLRWCRYYFYTHPTINAAVSKMAAYPLTSIHFDTSAERVREQWRKLLEDTLNISRFLYSVGLDYYSYGNAFIGIVFPFRKYLVCPNCKASKEISEVKYRYTDYRFDGECQECGYYGTFIPKDTYYRSPSKIRLIRWNPEDIDIEYNPLTGEKKFYYTLPKKMRSGISAGKKHIIETVPQDFIEAAKNNKKVVLRKCYHFARETISQSENSMGWGISMILPVLKHVYYMQILRKAQEMISQEHITPLRILFPTPNSGSSDPYSMINLEDWAARVRKEIEKWKLDPNYIPVMPIPVGNQTLGGDGRALMLVQELRLIEEEIIAGMGVPIEFVKGGLSYSGSSFSMVMLKNQFESYRTQIKSLLSWVIREVARFMGWEEVPIRLKRFHLADDLQRTSFIFQLNQAGKVSDKTLLEELNLDVTEEAQIIAKETELQLKNMATQQIAQAHMQGEAMKIQQRYQASAAAEQQGALPPEAMPPYVPQPPGPQPQGVPKIIDKKQYAQQIARKLLSLPEGERFEQLRLWQPYPDLHASIVQAMNELSGRATSAGEPLPEEKPPRRPPGRNPLMG